MKKIFILALVLFSTSLISTLQAQNINQPFVGLWEWRNGEEVFRVNLRIENDKIRGDFYMIRVNSSGMILETIYKSDKDIGHGLTWGPVIFGGSNDGVKFQGHVNDNSISDPIRLTGVLKMELIQSGSLGLPQATWKVKREQGIRVSTDTRFFNIPTDIVLTKVQ